MAGLDVTITVDEVLDASSRLARIESSLIGTTAIKSINKVADRTFGIAKMKMLSGINLSEADFTEGMQLDKATDPLKPEATIVGKRKSMRPTTMRRYFVDLILAQNRWSNSFVASKIAAGAHNRIPPGTARLPWKMRVGDKRRGIPAGQKARGVQVEVVRGRVKSAQRWFLLPTKNGLLPARVKKNAEKRWGRKGRNNYEVVYGPSIWQLFKAQIPGMREGVIEDLRKTLSADIRDDFLKALGK